MATGKAIMSLWLGVTSSTLQKEGQAWLAGCLVSFPLVYCHSCVQGWLPVCLEAQEPGPSCREVPLMAALDPVSSWD